MFGPDNKAVYLFLNLETLYPSTSLDLHCRPPIAVLLLLLTTTASSSFDTASSFATAAFPFSSSSCPLLLFLLSSFWYHGIYSIPCIRTPVQNPCLCLKLFKINLSSLQKKFKANVSDRLYILITMY